MAADVDVVVVGAGVVGLACAAALARAGRSVVVLERNVRPGEETTSRNSEVVHAGIYYPKDSLKAELCTRGRDALYARCESRGVPHQRIGKLIVATEDAELDRLEEIRQRALANGVPAAQPRHGAFPELIEATGGGLLVEPDSPRDLVDGLRELATDPERRRRLGHAGRAAVERDFDSRGMAERTAAVYERLGGVEVAG